jgi:hypothetical protein
MKFFKRNKKDNDYSREIPILVDFIIEARKLKWTDDEIISKFIEKNTPKDLILKAFEKVSYIQDDERGLVKMSREEIEDEDFEENEADDEIEDEEEEEKPVFKKKKRVEETKETKKVDVVKNKVEEIDNQLNQILSNHEQRLQQLEAAFFRLKGSI